jgi:hypothetical protein
MKSKLLPIILCVFCFLITMELGAQVQLEQLEWAPAPNYCIRTVTDGEPVWVVCDSIVKRDSIYLQNDTIFLRDGSGFVDASGFGGGGSNWTVNGTHIYNSNSGNVGIGVTNPGFKLDVSGTSNISNGRLLFTNSLNNRFIGGGNESVTGDLNIAIGGLESLTSGSQNVSIGAGAGGSITSGSQNLLIGSQSGTYLRSDANVAIGQNALRGPVSGGSQGGLNVAIGGFTMENMSGTGTGNVAIGNQVMRFGNNRSNCVGIGTTALQNATGINNVAIGPFTLTTLTTGTNNTAIGRSSGNVTTGSFGIFIGSQAGRYETQGNRLYIGSYNGTTEATGRAAAIIYGVQSATTSAQVLDLNAKVKATYKPNTATGIAGYDADGYFANVTLGSGLTITSGTLSATGGGGGGIDTLNGLTATNQTFETGTTGTDFNINSSGSTHTFNLPTASATNRGALSSADWTSFNAKPNGSGVFNKVAFWSGTNTLTSKTEFHWDNTNNRLGIGTSTPDANIHTTGTLRVGNRTPAQPGTVAGWTANGDAATVTIGTGLQLSFGTLSSTVVNTDNQQLSRTGNTLNLTNSSSLANALVSTSGANGQVLTWNSGTYAWATPSGASNWTLSGSNLFPNSTATNVIIGSTGTAARKLHVQGDMRVTSLVGNPNTIIGTNNDGDVGAFFGGANIFVGGGIISGENWYAQRASAATQSITIGTSYVKVPIGTISADYTSNGPGLNANPSGSGNDNTILITQQGDYEFTFCTCFQGNADDATYMDYLLYSATNGNGSPTTHNRLYMRETWTFGIPSCISKSVIITINTGNNNRYWSIRAKKNAGSSNTVDFYNPTFTIKRLK